jgi:hypothetical protein
MDLDQPENSIELIGEIVSVIYYPKSRDRKFEAVLKDIKTKDEYLLRWIGQLEISGINPKKEVKITINKSLLVENRRKESGIADYKNIIYNPNYELL